MTNHEKIIKLVGLWYRCLVDHHKDRDCHFYIGVHYSYDGQVKFFVEHYGYILDDYYKDYFNSLKKAEENLIEFLKKSIREEATRFINLPKDDWAYITEETRIHLKKVLIELEEINDTN